MPTWFLILSVVVAVLQAVASIFVVATFFVYFRLLKETQRQIAQQADATSQQTAAARQSMYAHTTAALAAFLHSERVYEARRHLLGKLTRVPYDDWKEDDKSKARHAIGAYDIAAILATVEAVPIDVVARSWGTSVIKCEAAGAMLIGDLRAEHGQ